VLRRLGFTGWRTRLESYRPADVNGGCAQFEEGPRGTSNAAWTLARGHVVVIMTGPPRPIAGLLARLQPKLRAQTDRTCRTIAGAEALAQRAFSTHGLTTLFATTREPDRETLIDQRSYRKGCAVIIQSSTAPDRRTVLVWLLQRDQHPIGFGRLPTLAVYHAR
jgi:hypothetical protein